VHDLLRELMDSARLRVDYADARYVRTRVETIATRNGELDELDASESEGVGVRVRLDGAWGFAATRGLGRRDVEDALERALAIARAQPRPGASVALAAEPAAQGSWATEMERDPFDVPLEPKLAQLAEADAALRAEPGVSIAIARFEAMHVDKLFASTEGALCEQHSTECGGGIAALAVDGDHTQVRSFPASHGGQVTPGGYERFLALGLTAAAPRVAEEAAALLSAPACPQQRTTLILAGEQLGLQIHESVGHAVELDRVLGREASYAGTSFLPADGIGSFRLGSEQIDVTADATNPLGLGSFRWDDEGVEGQRVPIVRDGVLAGCMSSRETAAETGLSRSGGCMRADGFARQPIVRMTNVNLEPRDAGTVDDLVADTEDGILVETNRSWSIDDRRLHFQFEGEAAWEIRGGERGRLLRNPSYAGVTPEFWGSCDAVCSPSEWRLISLLGCGKGEPGQVMRVSHGCAPARFRDVEVGVA
jgi:TldD protein